MDMEKIQDLAEDIFTCAVFEVGKKGCLESIKKILVKHLTPSTENGWKDPRKELPEKDCDVIAHIKSYIFIDGKYELYSDDDYASYYEDHKYNDCKLFGGRGIKYEENECFPIDNGFEYIEEKSKLKNVLIAYKPYTSYTPLPKTEGEEKK